MKGVQIERALQSNILDVYALFRETVKEGSWNQQNPTEEQAKDYYCQISLDLHNPLKLIYLARKQRAFYGYIQCQLGPGPWKGSFIGFIEMVHVTKNKRKLGIAKLLTDRLVADCKQMGIKEIGLLCNDSLIDYWDKKRKAKKILNYMILET